MKFQLTKQKTITPVIGTRPYYDNQEMSAATLIREWDLFQAVDILRTIQHNCPNSNIELNDLVKWHIEIPENRKWVYTHLLVGSIHNDVYEHSVRFLETIVFTLDYID